MASFFGFGRRKEESDIPMASNNNNSQQSSTVDAPPRPASPPQGPPPTNPTFVPSPALTPPGGVRSMLEASHSDAMAIPNIHIFNPATAETANEDNEYQGEEHSYHPEEHLEEEYPATAEDEVQLKPSSDSYEEHLEDNYYQENHDNAEYDNNINDTNQWQQEENGAAEFEPANQQQIPSNADNDFGDDSEKYRPVSSPSEEAENYQYQVEDVEEGEENDVFPVTNNLPHFTPLRETNRNTEFKPSPVLSYSDDSGSLTPTTPSSAIRFRTPLTREALRFDTKAMDPPLPPKSPREEIFTPQFKQVHARTVRRRQNHQQNMQTLERRLAAITSNLANLTMDREARDCNFLKDHVCVPMEKANERMALDTEYQTSPYYAPTKNWMSLTTRLSHLETDRTQHANVGFPQWMRDSMDQPYIELVQEVGPALADETHKSEKREGILLRDFEAVAATARRRYHEERAARFGAFEVLRQQLVAKAKVENDPQRIEELLSKVRILRSKLEQERVERRMRDEHLKTAIEQEVMSMKRALLEAAGGDDFMVDHTIETPALSSEEDLRRTIAASDDGVRRTIAYH